MGTDWQRLRSINGGEVVVASISCPLGGKILAREASLNRPVDSAMSRAYV